MTIGFDFDDVLMDFCGALLPYHNTIYGTKYEMEDVKSVGLSELWNCSKEEEIKRVLNFYQSSEHWNAPPVDQAVEGVKNLKQDHSLFIVTSKPEELREGTLEWLDKHFPQTFDGVHFTNQYHGNGHKRTKGEVCGEIGIETFVDDMLHNSEDVANAGIPVLLFDTPWNQGEVKPQITRVHS